MNPQIQTEKAKAVSVQNKQLDSKHRQIQKKRAEHPVIWAFEAVPEEKGVILKIRDMLHVWRSPGQKIIPATVLSSFDLAWPLRIDKKMREKLLKQVAQKIRRFFQEIGVQTEDAQILPSDSLSIRKMALTLIAYAKRSKAEIVIIGSGAGDRSMLSGLGSFSETMIAISPVPVLVLGTEADIPVKISRIFFPTDLSTDSKKVFQKVIEMAQNFDAEIILFHHLDLQMGPLMMGPYGLGVDTTWLNSMWNDQKKINENTGRRWERMAIKAGTRCTYVADSQFGNLGDRMLAMIKQSQANIAVVGIKRGPLSQVIFGSVVRNLFARCPCPVVAIHSAMKRG